MNNVRADVSITVISSICSIVAVLKHAKSGFCCSS